MPDYSGAHYFMRGFQLIRQPGIRRFVVIPLLVNLLFFGSAFTWLLGRIQDWMDYLMRYLPGWLEWLSYLLWPLVLIALLIAFSFLFGTLANWLAAPFNGLLAEKLERQLLGLPATDSGSMADILKDIPRTLRREWEKLGYYLPKAVGFLLLFWLLPVAGQLLWFIFTAWMMAIQYLDYPFDNHKIPFEHMRAILKQHQGLAYSFGITATLFAMLPLINLIVMPVAICGATALWVEQLREETLA